MIALTNDWHRGSLARAVPGAFWNPEADAWTVEDPDPRAAAVMLKLFPELTAAHPELLELRDSLKSDIRPFDNATPFGAHIDAPRVVEILSAEDKALYEFQSIDLGYVKAVLQEHGGAYIGWERGLGKTIATCCLIDSMDAQRVLVTAPNTAKQAVWAVELEKYCPWMEILVLPNEKRKRDLMMANLPDDKPFVLVAHYEALPIIAGKLRANNKTRIGNGWKQYGIWDLKVNDEAHRLWNTGTQTFKASRKISRHMELHLSGSIIQNHPEELFGPLQLLFPQTYKSRWRDWNDRYFDYVESGYGKVFVGVKPDQIENMRQELGVFMVYRRKEDELDLPEKTEQTLYVDLSASQSKAYTELQRECLTRLDSGEAIKADDGLVLLGRLRQVATGLDLFDSSVRDSTKLDLALELIQDNADEAFVVFCWYRAAAHSMADRLEAAGIGTFVVDGDVPHATRADYISRFQAGEGRVFIGTLSTLSESVTLHRASNAIFIDRSWNPATNIQAADRIYRIGQVNRVTITHIVARNTVDELRVLPALLNKEALRAAILGGAP